MRLLNVFHIDPPVKALYTQITRMVAFLSSKLRNFYEINRFSAKKEFWQYVWWLSLKGNQNHIWLGGKAFDKLVRVVLCWQPYNSGSLKMSSLKAQISKQIQPNFIYVLETFTYIIHYLSFVVFFCPFLLVSRTKLVTKREQRLNIDIRQEERDEYKSTSIHRNSEKPVKKLACIKDQTKTGPNTNRPLR